MHVNSAGAPMRIGELIHVCVGKPNQLPSDTQQAATRTWMPDTATWTAIKKHSSSILHHNHHVRHRFPPRPSPEAGSPSGFQDPVAAPIFYRDVPLMPPRPKEESSNPGAKAVPLIGLALGAMSRNPCGWYAGAPHLRAQLPFFFRDGKIAGYGSGRPQNDKRPVTPLSSQARMSIRNEDVVAWILPRKIPGDRGKFHVPVSRMGSIL